MYKINYTHSWFHLKDTRNFEITSKFEKHIIHVKIWIKISPPFRQKISFSWVWIKGESSRNYNILENYLSFICNYTYYINESTFTIRIIYIKFSVIFQQLFTAFLNGMSPKWRQRNFIINEIIRIKQ